METDRSSAKAAVEKVGSLHMKHMELHYYFLKSLIERGIAKIKKVRGLRNAADCLTKAVSKKSLEECVRRAAQKPMAMTKTK